MCLWAQHQTLAINTFGGEGVYFSQKHIGINYHAITDYRHYMVIQDPAGD